ncbi:UNVERIFIED_ORG: pyruvate/2-oxoglutarate dehydrogenase complex dihydrolipoamide dehydrogenase (E3) component [Rhizobium sp. SORGH_AS260]|uniref:dihydrolipoyl dehydrogenase family protein n=1 Tax=Agrobacterium sp. SORGH_AS_0440 TaxID=3041757 RepID=UPI000DE00459|nr:FAD-dependent oxidoreductase [Agrobacterium sp. SORGH_AS_0440]MDP9734554.1 pyruvate/2-oxoglutarate dehydrogenase complex dihydrolipoamide dehydrogenase (E3) component [Rhizobium sp. SORGH_AS_0285]MDP9756772.1 pyruvate/2-oxoglutarate dehydrogenase complex dihydrolipoamide dehydrogenase (E3) component [Rhizobium sp. SORGH_AS_0260]MDR6083977.1 pyruvate/2-oxoglutarate dehydrogenase complex dihydrolipoamide dehydrogenase (E3) component [Agrobacterium sp. SORGH_AS_0440]
MNVIEKFDFLIFGGGKAGKTLAMEQAKAGKKVAVVEAGMIGGSCINVACIPSKTLIRSAEVAHTIKNTAEFGVTVDSVRHSIDLVRDRTARVVAEMVATNKAGFNASGFDLILGWGRFVAPKTIQVETENGVRMLTGDQVFINLGTVADIPDVPGLAEADPITHVDALKLGELPTRLIVIGGGYIGMELGQAFRRLGAEVTIVERGPRLAPREDVDVSEAILKILNSEGVDVALSAYDLTVSGRSGDRVTVHCADGRSFEGSHILVASGRKPRTANIGLELAGVEVDERGFVKVDDRLRTTAPDVWAMGEVAGTPMFTHASLDDYRIVKSAMSGGDRTTKDRTIPYCVFIDPEFARIGKNETDMAKDGADYRVANLPVDVIPRARTLSLRKGFMKAIVARDSDIILGFSMLGVNAGEVMSVVQMAMQGGLPFTALRDGIFAHPTITEGLNMLFANLGAPITRN